MLLEPGPIEPLDVDALERALAPEGPIGIPDVDVAGVAGAAAALDQVYAQLAGTAPPPEHDPDEAELVDALEGARVGADDVDDDLGAGPLEALNAQEHLLGEYEEAVAGEVPLNQGPGIETDDDYPPDYDGPKGGGGGGDGGGTGDGGPVGSGETIPE